MVWVFAVLDRLCLRGAFCVHLLPALTRRYQGPRSGIVAVGRSSEEASTVCTRSLADCLLFRLGFLVAWRVCWCSRP